MNCILLFLLKMSETASKINANKLLDELLKNTSSCYGCIGKTEDLSVVEVNEVKNELEKASKKVNRNGSKTYVIEDQSEHEISNEVVLKYIGSWMYDNLIDLDSRNGNKIDTGYPLKYLDEIVRYMANEYHIYELNGVEFVEFCRELMEMNIPFRSDIMNRIYNGYNEYGIGWKNRCVIMNEKKYKLVMLFMNIRLGDLQYNREENRDEIIRNSSRYYANEILNDFKKYLKAPSTYVKNYKLNSDDIINLFYEIGVDTSNELIKQYLLNYTNSFFCYRSKVLESTEYDSKLKEWIGDYKWKLIYRTSEHGYSAESFHECCDDVQGPTLIIIKSIEGWILGGYTTQSWKAVHPNEYGCIYNDMI